MIERSSSSRRRLGSVGLDATVGAVCALAFWLPLDAYVTGGLVMLLIGGMLLRSRWPLTALGIVTAVTIAGLALGSTGDPFVAVAWTLYPVAVAHGTPRSLSVVKVSVGLVVVAIALLGTADGEGGWRYSLLSLLALAGAWVLGGTTRLAMVEAEHATRAKWQAAVVAERLRVVREVHDIVSHSLGTIAMTAGVTVRVRAEDPSLMRDRLQRIEQVSRQALEELRATLAAVRGSEQGAERRPRLGVSDLPALVERARAAGVAVTVTVAGVDALSASMDLAVYRIVQEGLTNVVRHAPEARCAVTVRGSAGKVLVIVADEGGGARTPSDEPGYGLIGLRERVELLGGHFTAGPRTGGGGFELRATIPVPAAMVDG
ncbi:sensor histidine kinase [Nonomuraea wenchangensis]